MDPTTYKVIIFLLLATLGVLMGFGIVPEWLGVLLPAIMAYLYVYRPFLKNNKAGEP
jgi:4-hydroxybenzoate polyprenyltransferase